ncbi:MULTISPECIES: GntR family transcriptional regulator [unclassified Streptomyces]|uniref:GntR family transcriptional regulator n=1 Tax=unclassified Streptomyces TaxID=2593676 RepID=UPI0022514F1D|nr:MULTISPECIES: GntR family transcriptional regulator [unclassified Streptomyces]WSP56748.1 GntR family transcriptional regulator [Streptomyces sp. NBC_01241]WSU22534.1 GntR family transcriptional regulator [Streptomyces sp. NBC_01108]MCX4788503.1 GntR family transcriptional regulator [Streptomyces sp. NBC_01221]MCX4795737.1 GntR family transcriptional regulator [Streptomyces sp. NBC_01242]WSJ37025.1 GntR family transcriptional regulator [Streptomyces sp. NBC_01321]
MAEGVAPRQMLTDTVYDAVRQLLVDHDIEPGGKVKINALAQELDVSPTPVREALARLEAEGLLARRSLAGYTAAPLLNAVQFSEMFEMRILLEPAATARAAHRIREADLAALDEHLTRMREVRPPADRDARRAFMYHDSLFHARIAEVCGSALMREMLDRLHAHAHLYRLHFRDDMVAETCREHARILEALSEHDAEVAESAMRSHIRRSRERLAGTLGDE